MLGTAVMIVNGIVPKMGGSDAQRARVIQTMLLSAGIGTLGQTLFGTRLPTVVRPSRAFLVCIIGIVADQIHPHFLKQEDRFIHTIREIQGAIVVCSILSTLLGYSSLWGRLCRLFTPKVVMILVCGVAYGQFSQAYENLQTCVGNGMWLGVLVIFLGVVCEYLKKFNTGLGTVLERFSILICGGVTWAFLAILTASGVYDHVDYTTKMSCSVTGSHLLADAEWISIPYPFQWGPPIFRASHVIAIVSASIVSSIESTGVFYAEARMSNTSPPPSHVISRSIGMQGIVQMLDGIFGSIVGSSASVENCGLLGLTGVGSRVVVQVSSAFMIFFSLFGKFGAFFAIIPLPIYGAAYFALNGIVGLTGYSYIGSIVSLSRRKIAVVFGSLALAGLVSELFKMKEAQGFVKTNAGWFNDITNTMLSSPTTIGLLLGLGLDNLLRDTTDREIVLPRNNGAEYEFYGYGSLRRLITSIQRC